MSMSDIETALVERFVSAEHFLASNISFENHPFTPPEDIPWCKVFFVPADPSVSSLGEIGLDRVDGFMQIDLHYKIGEGNGPARRMADAIRDTFKAGTELQFNGQAVTIKSCGRTGGKTSDGFFKIFVSVYWFSFLSRS